MSKSLSHDGWGTTELLSCEEQGTRLKSSPSETNCTEKGKNHIKYDHIDAEML